MLGELGGRTQRVNPGIRMERLLYFEGGRGRRSKIVNGMEELWRRQARVRPAGPAQRIAIWNLAL